MKDTKKTEAISKHLAKLLDVPTWLVKESIGIPLEQCPANSIEAAKMALVDADDGSDEERAAFEKLQSLLLSRLKIAGTKEMKEIYYLAKEFEMREVEIAAFHSWDELAMIYVEKAKTDKELEIAYEKTPKNSNSQRAAIEKKSQWSLKSLSSAQTLDDHVKACKSAPENSDAKRIAIKHIYDSFFKA